MSIMKHRILLFIAFFFVSHYVYSQRVANAMPLDIPLNSTKESAVQKLLRYNYNFWDSYEQEGFKVLEYKREYNKKKVRLWLKNSIVSIVSWTLDYDESCVVLAELKDVYDFKPYAQIDEPDTFGDEQSYFYWKGNTIIVGCYELFILSNADAEKRYQKVIQAKQEQKSLEQERKERERQERQEQIRREQERLERREAERKQDKQEENLNKDDLLNQRTAKYSSCRFLFGNDITFNFWIITKHSTMHDEIIRQIDKKMQMISKAVVVGTELSDDDAIRDELVAICNISVSVKDDSILTNSVEEKITAFVLERDFLAKAYKGSGKKNCADFLLEYCNSK